MTIVRTVSMVCTRTEDPRQGVGASHVEELTELRQVVSVLWLMTEDTFVMPDMFTWIPRGSLSWDPEAAEPTLVEAPEVPKAEEPEATEPTLVEAPEVPKAEEPEATDPTLC